MRRPGLVQFSDRLVTVRCPAANGLSRILEGLHGYLSTRPRGMTDSLMTRAFQAPGIVGPRSRLSPRRCSTVQAFRRPCKEISTTSVQRFLARKNTVRRGSVERNSLPTLMMTDRVNSSLYGFGGYGRRKRFRISSKNEGILMPALVNCNLQ